MEKLDLKKKYKDFYSPSARSASLVDVPSLQFVMMDGVIPAGGSPDTAPDFANAMEGLYGISYGLKFACKKRDVDPVDYTVMPLEALWWVESGDFEFGRVEPWYFTAMIMQPELVSQEMIEAARVELAAKKPELDLSGLRFEPFLEGLSVQILHVGPYSEEQRSLEAMESFTDEQGYQFHGKHHEVYRGDPRRAKPENLKTVLRHPVMPK
ncbi:MAG: GyrI-like domain-containing protein [Anaerolineales bacterium]